MILNHTVLEKTFAAFGIHVPIGKLILFSVRGATPQGHHGNWRNSWEIVPAKLDYKHMRCTIGIWNPDGRNFFLAVGSTVPHYAEVLKAAEKEGKGANQLEPGFYSDFYKGEHLEGKLKGHQALRQTAHRFLRRSSHRPPYTNKDPLYFSNPYDNLHCSWNPKPKNAGFSSAGCIVVTGLPHCKRINKSPSNSGSWKFFHNKIYSARQNNFSLLLLEMSQLKKTFSTKSVAIQLCYGSEGEQVKKLQRLLKDKGLYKGPVSGKLGVRTFRAWNGYSFKVK